MPSTVVNITAQAAVGASPAGDAAGGPLGVFDAIMSAVFAGAEGLVADGKAGAPATGLGAAPNARHNLDVAKLPATAHPAKLAAALAGAATPDAAQPPAASATGLADGSTLDVAPLEGEASPVDPTAADPKIKAATSFDAAAASLAAAAVVQAAPAAVAPASPAGSAPEAGSSPPSPAQPLDAAPPAVVSTNPEPALPLAEPQAAAAKATACPGGDDKPGPIPGAHASDTARLHAAPKSAVAQAPPPAASAEPAPASAAAPAAGTVPAEPGPAETNVTATRAAEATLAPPPAPSASTAAPSPRKAADKPARAQHEPALGAALSSPATSGGPASATGATKADKNTALVPPPVEAARAEAPKTEEAAPPPHAEPARAQAASPTVHAAAAEVRGSPETVASLAAQIVKKLGARSTHFDVELDPAGLGRVNVRVAIGADGQVSAAMRFDNPQAAAELKSRSHELQRALAQSGFDVAGGMSFDVAQDRGGGQPGQQNPFLNDDNPGRAFRGRAFAAALETAGDAAQAALPDRFGRAAGAPRGVDVRV